MKQRLCLNLNYEKKNTFIATNVLVIKRTSTITFCHFTYTFSGMYDGKFENFLI